MSALGETEKEWGAYGCASEDVDVVEMNEDLDDEFCRKVLDGSVHGHGMGFLECGS